ncbi:MAG: Rrf2 family transcriptional regulator, partial [Firmicutes bacterium]|nr:Rrf2 family transcriptional regulator [Bacillota bacterium]
IVEGSVDGFLIDLIQPHRLVEVQTANFSAIKRKLSRLLENHHVHLVHPITSKRQILKVAPETGELLSSRKSPKKGDIYDLFSELIRIPELILHPHLTVEAVLVIDEEIRCADGLGSWRRRGVSIVDRRLVEVVGTQVFHSAQDYLAMLPKGLPDPFVNKELAQLANIPVTKARKVTYTLKHSGLLREVGKSGNEILHSR